MFFSDPYFALVCGQLFTFYWHLKCKLQILVINAHHFQVGSRVEKSVFYSEAQNAVDHHSAPPQGILVNPIYLPAPHEVAKALVTAFTTPPEQPDTPWFHQSLWHSIKIVFSAFLISSTFGIQLGILCGFSQKISLPTRTFC